MRIEILNDIIEIENVNSQLDEAIVKINDIIEKSGLILSYIEINGVGIFKDFYQSLINNLDMIEKVEIFLKSKNELILESLKSTKEYLERVFLSTDFLIDKLYSGVDIEFWDSFQQYLEGLQAILKVLESIRTNESQSSSIEMFVKIEENIVKIITDMNNSIENGDRTYMIDIIKYELKQELEKLNEEIIKLKEF